MKDNSQRTMKKRLMLSVFAALVFVLGFLTTVFYTIVTYESEESAKEQLNVYAYLISEQLHNIDQASFSSVVDKMKNLNRDHIPPWCRAVPSVKKAPHPSQTRIAKYPPGFAGSGLCISTDTDWEPQSSASAAALPCQRFPDTERWSLRQ